MTTTVIVGGVAGGMSTATRLRRLDENMEIIVVEGTGHVSFANCGLPYHVSDTIPKRSSLLLQTPQSLRARFNLDVRVNTLATAIDREAQTVTLVGPDGTSQQHYDYLVLSPGGVPIIPPIPGIDRALTLRTVEDLDAIKEQLDSTNAKSAALIGGGFIGLELAENLVKRGMDVTVIEKAAQILAPLDPEMANIVTKHLEKNGVKVITGADTTAITEKTVELKDGQSINAELVVAAIGVRPRNELAVQAGLEVGERGGIKVDEQLRTNDPRIFALGDAAEKIDAASQAPTLVPLAQTANRHGRLLADIIAGRDDDRTTVKPTLGTAIVGLFELAAGAVGWNEKRARAEGRNVRIIHLHPMSHAGYYPGAAQLHLKLVIDAETDLILGAQAVGRSGVDKRIDVISMAMRTGMKAQELADVELAYSPQYGSAKDPINMAGFIDDNILRGERTFQWYEVEDAINDGWTLVDVRTPGEYERGTLPGAVNISVDELRDHIDELRGKKLLVNCQVGLRGHIAVTILSQYGIEAANLDGGYLTYSHGTQK
ncbi:FAD-dependent oxidoreductase [Boudabousia marimammalium]|uniref:CoA-disulfide reductase n=1 Tax=Boudabousia marimammalium TaxID=156892 RepID=A0A1Q5PT16_9ACTO|nr:FAD-dependent oxidoreductase [Boudabousia marimammalium]OKL50659.1 CoA-disulfide reductase [Boudabousia marimammalium]